MTPLEPKPPKLPSVNAVGSVPEDLKKVAEALRVRGSKAKEVASDARVEGLDSVMDHNEGRGLGYFTAARLVEDFILTLQGEREKEEQG